MIIKQVNRYECEYCGKKNYSAPHMKKHEKHCTKNPDRECRLCKSTIHAPDYTHLIPIPEVVNLSEGPATTDNIRNIEEYKTVLAKLKDITECPACVLSIIRQANIPKNLSFVLREIGFDYITESTEYFRDNIFDESSRYFEP